MSRFPRSNQPPVQLSSREDEMITLEEAVQEIQTTQAELIAQHQMQCQRASELEEKAAELKRRELWIQKQTKALDMREMQFNAAEAKSKAAFEKLAETTRLQTEVFLQKERQLQLKERQLKYHGKAWKSLVERINYSIRNRRNR